MAKGKKTGGRDFQPGQSGNPAGGPGLPQALRDARKMNVAMVQEILQKLMDLAPEDFDAYQPLSMHEKMVHAIIAEAVAEGLPSHLNFLYDRIIGKVKDQLEVTLPKPFIVKRSDGTEVVMGSQVEKKEGE